MDRREASGAAPPRREDGTLRGRMGGAALPVRQAIDYALAISRALAASQEKGVAHLRLCPEGILFAEDGGLEVREADSEAAAAIAYRSPEEARGEAGDFRSSVFSFGAILYEMLSGRRAFSGSSSAETAAAILKDDPPDPSRTDRHIPPALDHVVRRCLEKRPEERFQSAYDLTFVLETLSALSGLSGALSPVTRRSRRPLWLALAAVLGIGLAILGAFSGGRSLGMSAGNGARTAPLPEFRRLTHSRGTIDSARFAADGHTIVYSAAWAAKPIGIYTRRVRSPESRPLGLEGASLLSLSGSGELAVALRRRHLAGWMYLGTLARIPLGGGAARELLEDVLAADWSPDGKSLAAVRRVAERFRLEFPLGRVLYDTGGWISHPRVSPKGDLIAFLDHPVWGDNSGSVSVVDRAGNKTTLTTRWASERGLAWSPAGDEIWFAAAEAGARVLRAVDLAGRVRVIASVPGAVTLHDVASDGRVLLAHDTEWSGLSALAPGEARERDLSWMDYSIPADLSRDGKAVLFAEQGEGGGAKGATYLRKTDGSPAVRLSSEIPAALSPDGKWAITIVFGSPKRILLVPTGAGESRKLDCRPVDPFWARWLPDGRRIVIAGREPDRGTRLYVHDLAGGRPRPITREGVGGDLTVSVDGEWIAVRNPTGKGWVYPVEGGEPRAIPGLSAREIPLGWSTDGRSLYVFQRGELPTRIHLLDLATGRRRLWRTLAPADPAGISGADRIFLTPSGESYVYRYKRVLSQLYLATGLGR